MSANAFETALQEKLQTANLYDMLNVMHNATNMDAHALINSDLNETRNIINTQIIDKFIDILTEIQKMKAEHDDDEQFASNLANDIDFDIPEVYPMLTIDNPDASDPNIPSDADHNQENDNNKEENANTEQNNDNSDKNPFEEDKPNPEGKDDDNKAENPFENDTNNDVSKADDNNDKPPGLLLEKSITQSITPKAVVKAPLSPQQQLKALYAKEEKKKQMRQTVKVKLKVGYAVDIYSASKKIWMEGIIKEIKGDILCVVYGRKMKWLKKDSKQLRPKRQLIEEAVQSVQ